MANAKIDGKVQAKTLELEGDFSALKNIGGGFSISDPTNVGIELGRRDGTPGTPYIDFHTDGNPNTDYNARLIAHRDYLDVSAAGGLKINNVKIAPPTLGSYANITCPGYNVTYRAIINFPVAESNHIKLAMFTINGVKPTGYSTLEVTLGDTYSTWGYAFAQDSNAKNWERQNSTSALVTPGTNTKISLQIRDDGSSSRDIRVIAFLFV